MTGDGSICTLPATHYLVGGSLDVDPHAMGTTPFTLDTGAGFYIIRRSELPPGWEAGIYKKANPQKLNDANGKPLKLGQSVWLVVCFANTLYRVKFIIADRLAFQSIIGTAFRNRNVLAILCTKQPIRFRNGEVPILQQVTLHDEDGEDPFAISEWTKPSTKKAEDAELAMKKKQKR